MKLRFLLLTFVNFIGLFSINAQDFTWFDHQFWVTGKLNIAKQVDPLNLYESPTNLYKKEDWVNNSWVSTIEDLSKHQTSSCNQLKTKTYRANRNNRMTDVTLDTCIYNNNNLNTVIKYDLSNAQKTEFRRTNFSYTSNNIKPDSISFKIASANNVNILKYDTKNRVISNLYRIDESAPNGIRTISKENYVYLANDNFSTYKSEAFDVATNQFVNQRFATTTYEGTKLITIDIISYTNAGQARDSVKINIKYSPSNDRVQSIQYSYYNTTMKKWSVGERDSIISRNSKNYPTQIDFQLSDNNGATWTNNSERKFIYFPGDTLVQQVTNRQFNNGIFTNSTREVFEYCGQTVKTKEIDNIDFNVYPNPANQIISIKTNENTEGVSISVLSITGQLLQKSNSDNIDVSNLHNGLYLIRVDANKKIGYKTISIIK
jgi:Secretion system C-terminal sorting domain